MLDIFPYSHLKITSFYFSAMLLKCSRINFSKSSPDGHLHCLWQSAITKNFAVAVFESIHVNLSLGVCMQVSEE